MITFPLQCSTVSCVVCGRLKRLDARGYPRDAGSIVRAGCGHHFCSECLLERVSHAAPHEYQCEEGGCGKSVAPFTIRRNIGDGTEPRTTECTWGGRVVGSQGAQPEGATMRASDINLRLNSGAHTAVPAQTEPVCRLSSLPPALLGVLWPAERVVMGMRVCKQLRRDLIGNCSSIVLVRGASATLSEGCVREDFRRLPKHLMVTLKAGRPFGSQSTRFECVGALEECKALVHLDLRGNQIGAEGAGRLAEVLGECKALAHLDLRDNQIGAEGVRRLAEVLGECKALAHLDLRGNRIGAEGAGRLAEVLGECKALAHLDLRRNGIGDEGVRRLAEVLGECKALAHLALSFNQIGDEGAGRLAEVLGECKALAHLELRGNPIGADAEKRLAGLRPERLRLCF